MGIILPTFEEYSNRKAGNTVIFRPDNDSFSYSAPDVMKYFDGKDIKALILINPDNPSGNYLAHDAVLELAEWTLRRNVRFILDESFVAFAATDDSFVTDTLLDKYPHMVVLKSMSEIWGIPGLRIGVMATSDEHLIKMVGSDLSIWNINSFAEFYLQICEKYKSDFIAAMECFHSLREAFYQDLKEITFLEPIPSRANYITCRLGGGLSALELAKALLSRHNIFIKDLTGKEGMDGDYIRLTVRGADENRILIEALRCYGDGLAGFDSKKPDNGPFYHFIPR